MYAKCLEGDVVLFQDDDNPSRDSIVIGEVDDVVYLIQGADRVNVAKRYVDEFCRLVRAAAKVKA